MNIDGLFERIGFHRNDTVGLALSGGGARGFSHVGVMVALEEFGIKPSVIAGVSSGSIAGVLYGAGLTPDEIRQCFHELSFLDFSGLSIPKTGFFKLNKFAKLLDSWLPVKNLEELKTPTVVCATNVEKGTQVAWSKGEIVPRVVASCSIPIIFKPVRINDAHYVDGGVLHNLPAWAIRDYCKTLIGSNCSPLDSSYKYKDSVIDIAMRTFSLVMKSNVLQDVKLCDYVIIPGEISKNKAFDIKLIDYNMKCGYEAAVKVLEKSAFNAENSKPVFPSISSLFKTPSK
jgi:NTE family protein